MGSKAVQALGLRVERWDLTREGGGSGGKANLPYTFDGNIHAYVVRAEPPLRVTWAPSSRVYDLYLREFALQPTTVRLAVDGKLLFTHRLAAGETRYLRGSDLPGLPWTFNRLEIGAQCPDAGRPCLLVPELSVNVDPSRPPAPPAEAAAAALCLLLLLLLTRLLPWGNGRFSAAQRR